MSVNLQATIDQQKFVIENLRERIDVLHAAKTAADDEAAHWMANHNNQVARARILIERTDVPIDRVEAYKQIGDLQTALALLQEDSDECDRLRDRLSHILRGVAVALKGPEAPGLGHSWHDLAEVAQSIKLDAMRFLACRMEARKGIGDGVDAEAEFVAAVDQFRLEHGL